MELHELTPEIVTPIFQELVEEFGEDYVYKAQERSEREYFDCAYRENGKPSCVVGHILDRAGVHITPDWEGSNLRTIAEVFLRRVTPVIMSLDKAQRAQDGGETWGTAFRRYKEGLKNYGE